MLPQENLAANFCGLLDAKGYKDSPIEWRILGQEQGGELLASWISSTAQNERSHIGVYSPTEKSFDILYSFEQRMNVIQASMNTRRTLLSFVIRTGDEYVPYIVEIRNCHCSLAEPHRLIGDTKCKQIMVQFLWPKKDDKSFQDKLLVFVHGEGIYLYKTNMVKKPDEVDAWTLDRRNLVNETIVKHFIWAQWDPAVQSLYYIHLKPAMRSSLEKDDGHDKDFTITLSAHQFHETLPRETVVSCIHYLLFFYIYFSVDPSLF